MSSLHCSLPPDAHCVVADGLGAPGAPVAALGLAGLAWRKPGADAGRRGVTGLPVRLVGRPQWRSVVADLPDPAGSDANPLAAAGDPVDGAGIGPPGHAAAGPGDQPAGGLHATPATTAAPSPARAASGPLRVLYIDDNPVNTLLMAAMFERLPGLALRCECDPRAGVALALADPPALLLVDIQMPGIDGFEVLRQLRATPATRAVPAIAVSANAMPQDLARGHDAGFADYLTKPLALQRLREALQAALPDWPARPIQPPG
jgi:CheY-like chemotaxis protein